MRRPEAPKSACRRSQAAQESPPQSAHVAHAESPRRPGVGAAGPPVRAQGQEGKAHTDRTHRRLRVDDEASDPPPRALWREQ
eukprot:5163221-Pyramimonas_sp.AAC.1